MAALFCGGICGTAWNWADKKQIVIGVVTSYKGYPSKYFVDIHPVGHRLEDRVRVHVYLRILALLLKRVFEIDCLGN